MSAGVITDWTVAEVHRFILNDIGGNVGKYADMFQENGVDGTLLNDLEDTDLQEIGVKNAIHRKKILNALRKLQEAEKPKRGPEMPSQKSVNPDTNPAILKSALRGCLLSLSATDEESVLNMMSTILGNEMTSNDRDFVIQELAKEKAGEGMPGSKNESQQPKPEVKADPSQPGSLEGLVIPPPPKPEAVEIKQVGSPYNMGGEGVPEAEEEDELAQLRNENQELKEKNSMQIKIIGKLKNKLQVLITTQLEEMTDIADEHLAGRSDLKRTMTQMQKLQAEAGDRGKTHEGTLQALKEEKLKTTQMDQDLIAIRALLTQKASELNDLQSTLASMGESMDEEMSEYENQISKLKSDVASKDTELNVKISALEEKENKIAELEADNEGKQMALTTFVTQNGALTTELIELREKSGTLSEANKELGEVANELENAQSQLETFKKRHTKLTSDYTDMKSILNLKNQEIADLKRETKAGFEQAAEKQTEIETLQAQLKEKEEELQTAHTSMESEKSNSVIAKVTAQAEVETLKNELEGKKNEIASLNEELTETSEALMNLTERLGSVEEEKTTLMISGESSNATLKEKDAEIKDLKNQIQTLQTVMSHINSNLAKTLSELDHSKLKIAELEAKIAELEATIEKKNQEIKEITEERDEIEETIMTLSTQMANTAQGSEQTEKMLQQNLAKAGVLETQVAESEAVIRSLTTQIASLNNTIEKKQENVNNLTIAISTKDVMIVELKLTVEEKNEEIKTKTAVIAHEMTKFEELIQTKENLEIEFTNTKAQLIGLRANYDSNNVQMEAQMEALASTIDAMGDEHDAELTSLKTDHKIALETKDLLMKASVQEHTTKFNVFKAQHDAQILGLSTRLQQIEKEIQDKDGMISQMVQANTMQQVQLRQEIGSKDAQIGALSEECEEKEVIEKALKDKNHEMQSTITVLTQQNVKNINEINRLQSETYSIKNNYEQETNILRSRTMTITGELDEMKSTVLMMSEETDKSEQMLNQQVKTLSYALSEKEGSMLQLQTSLAQERTQASQMKNELDNQKSVSHIQVMQKEEALQDRSLKLQNLQGEYASLKAIIKEMDTTHKAARARHQTELVSLQSQASEKEQQVTRLQDVIRAFSDKTEMEKTELNSTLGTLKREKQDAVMRLTEMTQHYQLAQKNLKDKSAEVFSLNAVIQAQNSTIQTQNQSLKGF